MIGIHVARGSPLASHMFYADDSYIYSKDDGTTDAHVLQMLNTFQKVSGQKINVKKFLVFFSKNTSLETKAKLCASLVFEKHGITTLI